MKSTVYVLHEYGAPTHYNALVELGRQKGFQVKFRVFSPVAIRSALYHLRLKDAFKSICFLLSLPLRPKTKIILGIAPFDKLLRPLSWVLTRHEVYYHTSFTHWDESIMAHPTKSKAIKNLWRHFISTKIRHIFAVSQKTREELIHNHYASPEIISIVNHSFDTEITPYSHEKDNSFIYVGRLIEEKGICELLTIFKQRPDARLTIVGDGELADMVKEAARDYKNIEYLGYLNGLQNLIPVYSRHSFVVLNSQRNDRWEELFGMAIIEGMACGCVPICTDHPGPNEIINMGINGFLSPEKEIDKSIDMAIDMNNSEYQQMRNNAITTGQSYRSECMAERWISILE